MALNELLEESHAREICIEMIKYLIPLWVAFCVGLVLGWIWKPKWASSDTDKLASSSAANLSSPCSSSSSPSNGSQGSSLAAEFDVSSKLQLNEDQNNILTIEDFDHLRKLVVMKDGGPSWIQMMDRSTPTMSYQAWRRDPKNGPPQYRSRTVFDDAAPEIVRDFFWDDSFRSKWDDMLAHSTTIEECATTGTMVVRWIRKFPFFCSDREYIIGRRIWESGRSFYCVTKGVPCESVPRRDKPRRVDNYYSSWCIRAVESRRGNGQLTACEVLLFHHEDMGIPWEIAKLGIRQGMWGAVRKIEPGLRAYQKERAFGTPLSQPALMAQINTKIDPEHLRALEGAGDLSETEVAGKSDKALGENIPKLLIFTGAIIIACSLDQGFLPKAFIFGVARRFANMGKKF